MPGWLRVLCAAAYPTVLVLAYGVAFFSLGIYESGPVAPPARGGKDIFYLKLSQNPYGRYGDRDARS
jgi:hypothetical protein